MSGLWAPNGWSQTDVRSPLSKIATMTDTELEALLRELFEWKDAQRLMDFSHEGTWNLRVNIKSDELDGGFVAECLDVPGAMSQGETEQEALKNLIDAVHAIETRRRQTGAT